MRTQKCITCGGTVDLCAHHIDGNPLNNDPYNVATMCRSCHTKLHCTAEYGGKQSDYYCDVPNCENSARKLYLCEKHYARFKKYGDPRLKKVRRGNTCVLILE